MKSSFLKIGMFALITGALITALIVAFSMSWFPENLESYKDFTIRADGVLYIYIPASIEDTGTSLAPAVAMPRAVQNGLNIDVLREYDENDPNPSYVSKAASIVGFTTRFVFYNEYVVPVQAVDQYGHPIFDGEGNPVYVQKLDEEGNPVFDANGNPVWETEPSPALISFDIKIKRTPYEGGAYFDSDEITVDDIYFTYEEAAGGGDALSFVSLGDDKKAGTVRVRGTQEIFIHFFSHVTEADELMDPALIGARIYWEIGIRVSLEGGGTTS
jgi:hypothetical protein